MSAAKQAFYLNQNSEISHSLRIPITTISGMLYFLQQTPLTAEQKGYLNNINQAANELLAIEPNLHRLAAQKLKGE